ncbi:hypothetical protein IJV79_02305, partial [bacterium]|nr:hypothetical protein [bacterium]
DFKALLDDIKELEDKSEKIIRFENVWHNLYVEKSKQDKIIGEKVYIKTPLKKAEIEQIKSTLALIEKNSEKSGFFVKLADMKNKKVLKKTLGIMNFKEDYEHIRQLRDELAVSEIECEMRIVETNIQKLGNLHVLAEQIRSLKKKRRELAINILQGKRRDSLKGLLKDQVKRQRLIIHSKSLVEKKQNLQNRLLESEDFRPLLEAFPCWCVTTYAISGSLPLKSGLFDVAIIDEASQCDIASCFPILYRAKKAVIVGDDKQLPHLSFLEKAKEQSFLSKYGIPDKYQLMWRFRSNSMFDIANFYSLNPVLLDEHFRSLPPVIRFSNDEFYGGRMKLMRPNSNAQKVLEVVCVKDGKIDALATKNLPEVEAIIEKVQELIIEDEKKEGGEPISIGIISPFRAQVEQIKASLPKVISEYMIRKHKIEIGTAHTFQGDERDVILMSWTFAENSFSQSLTFLQKPNLFNVAITRARYRMINFISKSPNELPDGILRRYLSFAQMYEEKYDRNMLEEVVENNFKNEFEKEVYNAIKELGHEVQAGVEVAGYSLDLLVDNKIAIECDGVADSGKPTNNMKKQAILERTGFEIKRITFREWQYSQTATLNRVLT